MPSGMRLFKQTDPNHPCEPAALVQRLPNVFQTSMAFGTRWVVVVQTSLGVWNTFGSRCTNSDVCTTTTKRVPNAMDVWNTLGSHCTNVAGSLRTSSFVINFLCNSIHTKRSGSTSLSSDRCISSVTLSAFPVKNIEYMLVSFDIKFIRRDQRQLGMARLAEPVRRVSGRAKSH